MHLCINTDLNYKKYTTFNNQLNVFIQENPFLYCKFILVFVKEPLPCLIMQTEKTTTCANQNSF